MRIYFTKIAERDFDNIQHYLELNWGTKVKDKFALKVRHSLELLARHPKLGTKEYETKDIYGLLIHKNSKLFYRIKKDRLTILSLFDTRQDPKSKPT